MFCRIKLVAIMLICLPFMGYAQSAKPKTADQIKKEQKDKLKKFGSEEHLKKPDPNAKHPTDSASTQKRIKAWEDKAAGQKDIKSNFDNNPTALNQDLVGGKDVDSEGLAREKGTNLLNNADANTKRIQTRSNESFEEHRSRMRTDDKLGVNRLGGAALDLMKADDAAVLYRDVLVGERDDRTYPACQYHEVRDLVNYDCTYSKKVDCRPGYVKSNPQSGVGILSASGKDAGGVYRFTSPNNLPVTQKEAMEESVSFYVEDKANFSRFRVVDLNFEDQLEIIVNGKYIFKHDGMNGYDLDTSDRNTIPEWTYYTIPVGFGGGGCGTSGGGNVGGPKDHEHLEETMGPCRQARAISLASAPPPGKAYKSTGLRTGLEVNLLPHLRANETNVVLFRLVVSQSGDAGNTNQSGRINFGIDIAEHCPIEKFEVESCQDHSSLTDTHAITGRIPLEAERPIVVDGKSYSDIWLTKATFQGLAPKREVREDLCGKYILPECKQIGDPICSDASAAVCPKGTINFECGKIVPLTVTLDSKKFDCPNGDCVKDEQAVRENDLEGLDDLACFETMEKGKPLPTGCKEEDTTIFAGKNYTCGKTLEVAGVDFRDCCEMDGLLKDLTEKALPAIGAAAGGAIGAVAGALSSSLIGDCGTPEKELIQLRAQRLGLSIGTFTTKEKLAELVEVNRDHESFCVYDSVLSKTIAQAVKEQAAVKKFPIDLGSKKRGWNCRFVKIEYLEQLDWDLVDWTDLKESLRLKDTADLKMNEFMTQNKDGKDPWNKLGGSKEIEDRINAKIKERFVEKE